MQSPKNYELDNEQQKQIEVSFLYPAPKDNWEEKFIKLNEIMLQTARKCMQLTPKCKEQTEALIRLQDAQHWFVESIRKHE